MSDLNIYQRINAVMGKVSYIKKDTAVTGGGANYRAVTRDAVVALVREEAVKAGIVIETSQLSGEWLTMRDVNAQPQPIKMGLYKGNYEIRFVNVDKPEDRAIIQIEAHANDNGDKAPGKAATYAEKTGLLKQFLLETGLNDEERAGEQSISQDQADRFGYLIESGDEMGLFMFMSQFPAESTQRSELFNSVPYGQKGKIKEGFSRLNTEVHTTFDEWANEISNGIKVGDDQVLIEYWDEINDLQKISVWGRLNESDKEFLQSRKLDNRGE